MIVGYIIDRVIRSKKQVTDDPEGWLVKNILSSKARYEVALHIELVIDRRNAIPGPSVDM